MSKRLVFEGEDFYHDKQIEFDFLNSNELEISIDHCELGDGVQNIVLNQEQIDILIQWLNSKGELKEHG